MTPPVRIKDPNLVVVENRNTDDEVIRFGIDRVDTNIPGVESVSAEELEKVDQEKAQAEKVAPKAPKPKKASPTAYKKIFREKIIEIDLSDLDFNRSLPPRWAEESMRSSEFITRKIKIDPEALKKAMEILRAEMRTSPDVTQIEGLNHFLQGEEP